MGVASLMSGASPAAVGNVWRPDIASNPTRLVPRWLQEQQLLPANKAALLPLIHADVSACRYGIYTASPAAQEPDAASSILDWVVASLQSLPYEGPAPSDLSSLDALSFDARAAWIVVG